MKAVNLFTIQRLRVCFFVISCSLVQVAWAQDRAVSGVVSDAEGEPLIGVSVVKEGTAEGTITDFNGAYQVQVPSDTTVLVYSYVGFEDQRITVGSRTTIDVTMRPAAEVLEEVVVTALALEKDKRSLGYATQSVDGDELTQAREVNVVNSLAGRVAGAQINQSGTGAGGTSKVVIRGYSSIAGNNSPLYVVDGVPMTNPQGGGGQFGGIDFGDGISNINPDDIKSINVLKGASATALYGSRGQNGVIMITTKKGAARKGIGVAFNSNATFDTPLVLPEFQNRFGRGSGGNFPLDENGNFSDATRVSWGARTLGQTEVNGQPLVNWTGEPTAYTPQPDNIRDFFRTGQTYTNSLAFSGGNEQTQARLSLSHLWRENIMPNSNLERINVNLNISSKLTDKLEVEGKVNYINQNAFNRPNLTLSPDNPMSSLVQMPRNIRLEDLQPFRRPDGTPVLYTNATGTDQWQNPYWAVNLNTNNDERDRVLGYALLRYRFNDYFKVQLRTGTDFYNDFRQNRNATNTIYRVTPGKSFYSEFYGRVEERNSDILFSYIRDLSPKVFFTANVGGNLLQQTSRGMSNTAQGLNVPNFFVLQNALSVLSSESESQKEIHSVYGTVSVDYDNFLFVEASARNDWSSALPAASRSYFYPSVSASLVLTDMLEEVNWGALSFAKLRASVAQVGNDFGPHQLDLNYVVNTLSHGGQTFGQIINTQPPVNIQPEETTSIEGGFEAQFWDNRLSVDFTYYNAGTRNQILSVPVSSGSGFRRSVINAGLIVNEGVEIALRATPIQARGFTYRTYLNFARNRSRVEELAENVEVFQLGSQYDQFGVRIQAEVGGEFGDIYADRAYLRDPETGQRIIGENGLPLQDPEGIRKIGNYQPDFLIGFGHNFSYKGWNLGALIDMRQGGDIFSFTNAVAAARGNAIYTQYDRLEWYAGAGGYVAEGVTQEGEPNTFEVDPQVYWQNVGGRASTFAEEFLYDGSFIKLRELTLGYQVPGRVLESGPFTNISIALVGRNLFFLHKNTVGFDPEATFNAGNDQGIEAFAFPSTRSMGINLKLTL